ncbi:hypothetical protein ACFPP8_22705, partial [Methylobacterium aerolatum]
MIKACRIAAALLPLGMAGAADAKELGTASSAPVAPEATTVVESGPFFLFSDTQVSYRYQFPTVSPGVQIQRADGSFVSREAPKQILN